METKTNEKNFTQQPDNLQRIQGIGPAVEKKLNQAGIHSCAQLAALKPEEIAHAVGNMAGFSLSRIANEDWAGQAQILQTSEFSEIDDEAGNPAGSRHYAVFTVQFLLDDDNEVRRTLVQDIQDDQKVSWAGWDAVQLTNIFIEKAGLNISTSVQEQRAEAQIAEVANQLPPPLGEAIPATKTQAPFIDGKLQLQKMALKVADEEISSRFINSKQPFTIQLSLDLSAIQTAVDQTFDYSVMVFAKPFGLGESQTLGESEGCFNRGDYVDLEISDLQLPPGAYHLDAFVKLTLPGATRTQMQDLMAMTESSVIQIY